MALDDGEREALQLALDGLVECARLLRQSSPWAPRIWDLAADLEKALMPPAVTGAAA